MAEITPCYGCEARHRGCHDKCGAYAKWKAEHQLGRDMEREKKRDMYIMPAHREKHKPEP